MYAESDIVVDINDAKGLGSGFLHILFSGVSPNVYRSSLLKR